MRLAGISSIEAANNYLQTSNFIKQHNKMFAVPPLQGGDAHASVQGYDLENIFATHETRTLAMDKPVLLYQKNNANINAIVKIQ